MDCATCPLAIALDRLDADNAYAWGVFHRLYSRLTHDWGLIPIMFTHETADLTPEDVTELVDRLGIIYAAMCPVPPVGD